MEIRIVFRAVLLLFLLTSGFALLKGQSEDFSKGEYLYRTHKKGSQSLNYRILYPVDFDEQKSYPLIVFLHGMGERGTDNETQLTHGSKLFQDSIRKYPAIVVFPQCPPTDYWANLSRPDAGGRNRHFTFHTDQDPNPTLALVIDLMGKMIDMSNVNKDRVYVSGLSMGGFGTWELMWRIPEKITAALPICGGAPNEMAQKMVHVPTWIFHGIDDSVVHPRFSMNMLRALQQAGGRAKISLYTGVDHNSWENAFAEPEYLNWMFSKKKN